MHPGDVFIRQQLSDRLVPGEQLRYTAYLTKGYASIDFVSKPFRQSYWAGLSDTMLYLIETDASDRVIRVLSFERSTLQCMWRRRLLYIKTSSGEDFVLEAPKNRHKTSTQAEFIEALTTDSAGGSEVRRLAGRTKLIAASGVVLALVVVWLSQHTRSTAVTVRCQVTSAGVVCLASLDDARGAVRACWDLELTCRPQQPTEETRVCVDVQGEESTRTLLQPQELERRGVCSDPVRADFHGLEVTTK